MNIDPYAFCPCGTGTKQKWCQAKSGLAQASRIVGLIENHQIESSLSSIDKLLEDKSQPECFHVFAITLKAQALEQFERGEEAQRLIESSLNDFPRYGLLREYHGDLCYSQGKPHAALADFQKALELYPPAAISHCSRTLRKIAYLHVNSQRYLAAWAAWQRQLKIDPEEKDAAQSIQGTIRENSLLPQRARLGLNLKSADEFTLFDEEQASRWEKALSSGRHLQLEDLVQAFQEVTDADPKNALGWYNLGISLAWIGNNAQAIEALARYVDLEPDFEEAADAWDLAEVLRVGAGAEDYSDSLTHYAVYEIVDPQALNQALSETKRLIVLEVGEDAPTQVYWVDKDATIASGGVPILGGPARPLAQIAITQRQFSVFSWSLINLRKALEEMERPLGASVRPITQFHVASKLETTDLEPVVNAIVTGAAGGSDLGARQLEEHRRYFEEIWLHRPLKSLANTSPLDAAQSPKLRKRLEGVVRFRERLLAARGVAYNLDRLRNKLGLPISGTGVSDVADPSRASQDVDLSAYSASQLSALNPLDLSDDDLVVAYRTALNLDAPQTATNFAEVLIRRDAAAERIDVNAVFRRLIQDRLADRDLPRAESLIEEARAYDAKHYREREQATFDLLAARAAIYAGRQDDAINVLRDIPRKYPRRLDVTASAVESLLSAGQYRAAEELAREGLQLAEQDRNSDLQAQFREYLDVAAERV